MKTLQRTFSIIKPDAVRKGATGDILQQIVSRPRVEWDPVRVGAVR